MNPEKRQEYADQAKADRKKPETFPFQCCPFCGAVAKVRLYTETGMKQNPDTALWVAIPGTETQESASCTNCDWSGYIGELNDIELTPQEIEEEFNV